MPTTAKLLEVAVIDEGSATSAALASGATSVPVDDPTPYNEAGGVVSIDGAQYAYTGCASASDGSGTLTLAEGVSAAVDQGQPVSVVAAGQVAQDWTATVSLDGGGDTSTVAVPYALRAQLPVGAYDPPVTVDLTDDLSAVADVPGRAPTIDGSYIDPATVPPPAPPTDPPASSPSLTATGDASGITLVAEGIDPTTWLDFYVDGVVTTEAQGLHTRATVVRLTLDSAGAAFAADTDYTFHCVASNVAGSAAAGPDVTTRLNAGVDSQTVLGWVAAGYVLAGTIQIGNITIDPNTGITIPLADGNQIAFPADGSQAVIDAVLRTGDIIVRGGLTLSGTSNNVTGTLSLASGVVAPAAAPQVSAGANTVVDLALASGESRGLVLSSDGTRWITVDDPDGYWHTLRAFDRTTGAQSGTVNTGTALESLTRIGTTVYALGRVGSALNVSVFDESLTGDPTGYYITNPGGGATIIGWSNQYGYAKASICTDGTSLYVVYVNGAGAVQIRQYATDGTPGTVVTTNWTGTGGGANVGVYNA
ncbi:MAG: hypothetical protein ACRDRL_31425, partial [Sciscionella sp.]